MKSLRSVKERERERERERRTDGQMTDRQTDRQRKRERNGEFPESEKVEDYFKKYYLSKVAGSVC